MRSLLLLAALFFTSGYFGQKIAELKVSKSDLLMAKTIHDVIRELPKDCKINAFIFSGNINGTLKDLIHTGGELTQNFKDILKRYEKGQNFFIQEIKSECHKSHKKEYKIVIL